MPRRTSAEPEYVTVYGSVPVIIGIGSKAAMEKYADRLNKQAPKYNHRAVPRDSVSAKKRKGTL